MARRATALKQFEKEHAGATIVQVDAGGTFNWRVPDMPAARVMWKALDLIGLDVMNLTPGDGSMLSRLGGEGAAAAGARHIQLVSANVTRDGKMVAPPYVVRRVGGVRLVITGVTEKQSYGNLGYRVEEPVEALRKLIPTVAGDGTVVILLAYMPLRQARDLPSEVSGLDIVISGREDSYAQAAGLAGSTWLLEAQHEGRLLGTAGLKFAGGKLARLDGGWLTLEQTVSDDPEIAPLVASVAAPRKP